MILTKLAPIAALGIFAALTPSPANEPAPENRHEIVAALFDTFNAHDAEGLGQFYTENAQVFSPETCTPKTGRLNIAAGYAQMFDQIPDIHDRLEKVIVDGNDVAVTFTATGTINGQTFAMPIAAFLTFEGNQIATDHVFFDADVTPDCSQDIQAKNPSPLMQRRGIIPCQPFTRAAKTETGKSVLIRLYQTYWKTKKCRSSYASLLPLVSWASAFWPVQS